MKLAAGLLALPVGARIRLSARPSSAVQSDERWYVTARGRSNFKDLTDPGETSGYVAWNGGVILRTSSDGPHIVEAFLHLGDDTKSQRIANVFPSEIRLHVDQGRAVFSIRIPPDDLAKTIERARRNGN